MNPRAGETGSRVQTCTTARGRGHRRVAGMIDSGLTACGYGCMRCGLLPEIVAGGCSMSWRSASIHLPTGNRLRRRVGLLTSTCLASKIQELLLNTRQSEVRGGSGHRMHGTRQVEPHRQAISMASSLVSVVGGQTGGAGNAGSSGKSQGRAFDVNRASEGWLLCSAAASSRTRCSCRILQSILMPARRACGMENGVCLDMAWHARSHERAEVSTCRLQAQTSALIG